MAEHALAYASSGMRVFPCHHPVIVGGEARCSCHLGAACRHVGKHPMNRDGLLGATADLGRIEAFWGQRPDANVAIVTGSASGFDVLDVDPRHGGDLSGLDVPPTRRARTGSGGEHVLFIHTEGMRNAANRPRVGLDVRGDGGYVVAPPSLHASGRRYEWINDAPVVEPPSWFAELAVARAAETPTPSPEAWTAAFVRGAAEGERNDSVARMTGYLLGKRLPAGLVTHIVRAWNRERFRPPLSQDEVDATIESICAAELRKGGRRVRE